MNDSNRHINIDHVLKINLKGQRVLTKVFSQDAPPTICHLDFYVALEFKIWLNLADLTYKYTKVTSKFVVNCKQLSKV